MLMYQGYISDYAHYHASESAEAYFNFIIEINAGLWIVVMLSVDIVLILARRSLSASLDTITATDKVLKRTPSSFRRLPRIMVTSMVEAVSIQVMQNNDESKTMLLAAPEARQAVIPLDPPLKPPPSPRPGPSRGGNQRSRLSHLGAQLNQNHAQQNQARAAQQTQLIASLRGAVMTLRWMGFGLSAFLIYFCLDQAFCAVFGQPPEIYFFNLFWMA
ncbi:hypothetical protein HK101_005417 [Irineochytrium annulatum]|nr:hypothetical protein HK101_005417 [Irineochytrium annulatum]